MKQKIALGLGIVIAAGVLAGCSGSSDSEIKSLDELRDAYVEQGFNCASPTIEEDDTYKMYGCENRAMLTFVKNADGEKRHKDTSETMGSIKALYVQSAGEWHISSFDRDLLAPEIGGEIKTYN